jgi:hypothetical protein
MNNLPIHLPKAEIEQFCEKYHIVYLALFGSVLTSRFNSESDIDILVKFKKKHIPHLLALSKWNQSSALFLDAPST